MSEFDYSLEDEEQVSSSDIRNYFKSEEDEIRKLMGEIDSLYDETKNFFDKVVYQKTKGTLNFIKDQTSNLINMKNSKLSLIRELASIKKISLELDHKLNSSDDSSISQKDAAIIKKIMSEMDNAGSKIEEEYGNYTTDAEGNLLLDEESSEEYYEDDDDLEKEFNSRKIELNDAEKAMKYEKLNIRVVVYIEDEENLEEWQFMAIDGEYNEIEDYPLPDRSLFDMIISKDKAGDLTAKDQNGRTYEVVT